MISSLLTDASHQVNEGRGDVELKSPLTGGVVVGEGVVVIMESLTHGQQGDCHVLHGSNLGVVRLHPEHVGCGVD